MRSLFLVSVTLLAASFSNGENLGIRQLRTSEAEAYPCGQPVNARELHPFSRGRDKRTEKELCNDLPSIKRRVAELESHQNGQCKGRNPWDQRCSRATQAVKNVKWNLNHSEEACKCLSAPSPSAPVFGDLDGKRGVRGNDVIICLRHVKNIRALTGDKLVAADVDKNGKVDLADCALIQYSAAGMLSLPAKITFGDLNGNGRVDIGDVTKIRRHLKNISPLTGNHKIAADVNVDSKIDDKDSELIRRAAAGLEKLPKTP